MLYIEASLLFSKCRNRDKGYRLPGRGGKTRLVACGFGYGIKYCDTVVVKFNTDGTYRFNTDGHFTRTTRERIEEYSPVRITSFARQWYFSPKKYPNEYYLFLDGPFKVSAEGRPELGSNSVCTYEELHTRVLLPARRARARARYQSKVVNRPTHDMPIIKSILNNL